MIKYRILIFNFFHENFVNRFGNKYDVSSTCHNYEGNENWMLILK